MVTWSENIVTSTQHICKMYFSVPKAKFFLFFFCKDLSECAIGARLPETLFAVKLR